MTLKQKLKNIRNTAISGGLLFIVGTSIFSNNNVQAYNPRIANGNSQYNLEQQIDKSPSFADAFGLEEQTEQESLPENIIEPKQGNLDYVTEEISKNIDSLSESFDRQGIQYPEKSKNSRNLSNDFLTDKFFRDSNYVNASDIHQLLVKKNSCLKYSGVEKVITKAAQEYNVNPMLLLARLQVEKSLISKSQAKAKDIKYAMGFGCRDDGITLPSKGIEEQITNAARILNQHYQSFRQGKSLKIDYGKRTIIPESAAVHALLKYTPHTRGYHLNKEVIRGLDRTLGN